MAAAALLWLAAGPAWADKPAPYALPWQLRPAAVANVVRSDTAFAFHRNDAGEGGTTVASMLLGSWKITPAMAPFVRLGMVRNAPPGAEAATSVVNPAFGGTWLIQLRPELRLALVFGLTLPIGMGGGDSPDAATAAATRSGVLARSGMDNAMFAVNDVAVFPGVDLAWVRDGFTIQAEATVLKLTRVRGDDVQPDEHRTNFTSGLYVGWFASPALSLGAELRFQRWLSTPAAVAADAALRETVSIGVGARAHLKLSGATWIRPGLAWARGLDEPMSGRGYNIVQVDVPVSF